MAKVNISNVVVLDNPSPFMNPFQFEITFECLEDLKEDLEWKITYVGSAESEEYDQVLDTVLVGPLVGGRHRFVFQAEPPCPTKIPLQDALGVTVVLLTCAYKNQEFIRVGYYVNNEYPEPDVKENPPTQPEFERLQRNILATCPRVTRFRIDWNDGEDNGENQPPSFNPESGSNQMPVFGIDAEPCKIRSDEGFSSKLPTDEAISNHSNGVLTGKVVLSGTSTDSNSMELVTNGTGPHESKQQEEEMQM